MYWIKYDAAGAARAVLAAAGESERHYDYISREDEERLNLVMREIDKSFIPVNTSQSRKQ